MLQEWKGRLYKRKGFSYSQSRKPPRKHLGWDLWRETLTPLLHKITNRNLKYPLDRWDKEAIYHWKWFYSITTNQLYARHGQVYKSYIMINCGSRRNEGNFIANKGFCKTLPKCIKEANVYYDWSYKLQSSITPQFQPTVNATTEGLCRL